MSDLISRQALSDAMYHEAFEKDTDMQKWDSGCWIRYKLFENVLRGIPSADVVEVVRCRDCKYFDSGTDEAGKLFFKCLGWVYGGTSEDGFCSHGERKDDEYISRQTVMNAFAEYVKRSNNSDFAPTPTWNDAVEIVENLPSADAVEVRHGTWIKDRYNNLDYVCSECGEPCADMVMGKPRDRYCKWCGARMGGET